MLIMKLRWTFARFLLLSVIGCFGIHGANSVTVITQPDNITVCEGGTAVFTCAMDITNVNVSLVDVKWWRIRTDDSSGKMTINTQALTRISVNNSISQDTPTSALMITDVRSSDIGPYWCVLKITDEMTMASNMAFLNILPNASSCTAPSSTDGRITNTASFSMSATATTDSTTSSMINTTNTTSMSTTISTATSSIIIIATTTTNVMPTVTDTPNFTRDSGDSDDSGGSSGGAIAGGVIGGIIVVVIIVIIIIAIYYFVFYRSKDNDDGKTPYYSVIASKPNGKNAPAVSNSVYDEVHKTEDKTIPHQITDTGELYAMSTKDTHNEPSLLYTYARVDLDTKRKITETSVPHQAAGDGAQYAVSTKTTAKDTDNDVSENTEDKEIKYADLQILPGPPDVRHVTNESSSQYLELVT